MAKLNRKKGFIFDLDGVIYLGNELVKGAKETIGLVRKRGKKIMFLTNSSTRSREGFSKRLKSLGIGATAYEILTSSHATALWLKNKYRKCRVLVVGENGLKEEMNNAGFIVSEENVDFVVVGLDKRFTYAKITKACFALQKGALLISTNQDATYPTNKGILPGAGTMVSALRTCSGKEVLVDIGKPNRYMLDIALGEMKLKKEEVVFVGDRVDTDIAMAKKVGVTSVLVLSGITKKKDLSRIAASLKPDFILDSIEDIKKLI